MSIFGVTKKLMAMSEEFIDGMVVGVVTVSAIVVQNILKPKMKSKAAVAALTVGLSLLAGIVVAVILYLVARK